MKADYLSYQHATNRSLLGLAIQFALGLVLLVYALYGHDHAALTAAFFVLIGVPLWLTLAMVFDQHRRERIEAVEAEAFAARDAAASSVFETQADDLRVAHKRLRWLYRYFVPGMSLGVAALLILVGLWRFRSATIAPTGGKSVWDAFDLTEVIQWREAHRGWPIAIGLGIAFVGFLFARYMSGMAKQKVWENLRAGAAYAAGTALMGLAIPIGHFIDIPGTDLVLRVLIVAYPVLMVVVGCEMVLWFVLELYRPRKAGEFPRPAFESRMLGFLAAPDKIAESIGEAINYQFGYDVTDSWVYRLLARSVFRVLIPVVLLVMWGLTCLTVIRPHERGLVLRFGDLVGEPLEPGLHFKWPWPIERVEVPAYLTKDAQGNVEYGSPTATGVRVLDIGTTPPAADKTILWTNEHAQETFFLVQPGDVTAPAGTTAPPEEGPEAGKSKARVDLAVLAAEVPLHYVIDNVKDYEELGPPEMRDDLLRAVAQRAVMRRLSSMTVGDLLGSRRTEVQAELRKAVEAEFTRINRTRPGQPVVKVLFVGLDGVHPPRETARLFEQVVEAEQKKQARRLKAEAEAIRTLTESVGSTDLAYSIVAELDKLNSMKTAAPAPTPEAIREQELRVATLIKRSGGNAAAAIQQASAERWKKHMGERALLAQYLGELGTYRAAPAVYRAGLYFDALKGALVNSRVFITDGKAPLNIRLDLTDRDTAASIINSQGQPNP